MSASSASLQSLRNLTPHTIRLYFADDGIMAYDSLGNARLTEIEQPIHREGGIPVHAPYQYGAPSGLIYKDNIIVSALVGEYLHKNNPDGEYKYVYSPDTSTRYCVRDDKGAIIGTRCLIRWC